MAFIKIEKEEYKKTSTIVDCNLLPNQTALFKIPIKAKLFRSVNKTKTKDKKTKQVMEGVEL